MKRPSTSMKFHTPNRLSVFYRFIKKYLDFANIVVMVPKLIEYNKLLDGSFWWTAFTTIFQTNYLRQHKNVEPPHTINAQYLSPYCGWLYFRGYQFSWIEQNYTFVGFKIRGNSISNHNSYRKMLFRWYLNSWIGPSTKTTKIVPHEN